MNPYFPSNPGEGPSRRAPDRNDLDFARSAYEAADTETEETDTEDHDHDIDGNTSSSVPPQYLVHGNGQVSENATSLMASLNRDSGYGGSLPSTSDGMGGDGWLQDRPTPGRLNGGVSERERRTVASHVLQLQYNQNRVKLSRAISKTLELLRELRQRNSDHPAYYPAPAVAAASAVSSSVNSPSSPLPHRSNTFSSFTFDDNDDGDAAGGSAVSNQRMQGHAGLRRSRTSAVTANGGAASPARPNPPSSELEVRSSNTEPRLVTPQMAHELSVLKVDLRVGSFSTADLASLEKGSIASLLDSRVTQSMKHLYALRDRIEDTSSKVLITGDLNAGKSTFCNALLRRKILPEDQQPCTSIFCEVLDARENAGIEEVHAIHKSVVYDRHDESTYDVYALKDLEELVVDNTKYLQCKVYVKDIRKIDESLLNNGVVDISIIDAPGLNSDSVKTTAIFARQEEIDVVVFVVSAANHFTLSAQEFIQNAAHEKTYMFIVVNGYDNIRDKKRCQQMVLKQVANLSPRTYKESNELVHFVSSKSIPVAPQPVPASSGSGGGGGDDYPDHDNDDNNDDDPDKGKGKDKGKAKETQDRMRDFETLETSLRRFVLEKRSHSKLAPARTYLMNLLSDLFVLASANRDVAFREYQAAKHELDTLVPEYDSNNKAQKKVHEDLENTIDEKCQDVFDHTRKTLDETIRDLSDTSREVYYPGLLSVFQYAEDLKTAMIDRIQDSVVTCEDYGRHVAVEGVNVIKSLGLLHVGNEKFGGLNFHADLMFRKTKHRLARQVDAPIDAWDFFDLSSVWQRQEKLAGAGAAMTAVTLFGGKSLASMGLLDGALNMLGFIGKDTLRRLAIPGILVAAGAAVYYILSDIPNSLPVNIQRKVAALLYELDYTHSTSTRISGEVRRVLRVPAKELQAALRDKTEELGRRKDEVMLEKTQSEAALKYFSNLFRESGENRRIVEGIDLEAPLPGAVGEFASM